MGSVLVSSVPEPYSRNPERNDNVSAEHVQVLGGVNDGMGGLEESRAVFKKHSREVGDALLNLSGIGTMTGEPAKKDDERPGYDPRGNEFPAMIYHPEKGEEIVNTRAELDQMLKMGWREEPYIKPQVALEDPKTEKLMLQKQLKEKDGEIATLADKQSAMEREMAELRAMIHAAAESKSKK